uniref:thiol-disulfide oxidoreductase DCC family protein n=2 Tax=Cyanothece sp. BG0011 TaxID=2082950 RepID=UPI001E458A07|nr:DUF393 domain-containing protein [Cyanothece sp. BG0011]
MMNPSTSNRQQNSVESSWRVELLYDGDCPLCMREVRFLRKKDQGRNLVKLVNIAEDNYDPNEHCGVDYKSAMGKIHAILPDGTILTNIEAFRYVYEVLGMGWVYAITKVPIIGKIANWIYGIWAKLRLPLTRRPDLETIIRERKVNDECHTNICDR